MLFRTIGSSNEMQQLAFNFTIFCSISKALSVNIFPSCNFMALFQWWIKFLRQQYKITVNNIKLKISFQTNLFPCIETVVQAEAIMLLRFFKRVFNNVRNMYSKKLTNLDRLYFRLFGYVFNFADRRFLLNVNIII